ncbi:MAG TPA: DNA gyrase inhibitor YacG [Dongiaceae bacterium]|nr:DNA gyrase inhibitor YacG [Dongiaceae bacterium]
MSAKCPICGKPVQAEFRPFCSARCKQVDLNRWLSEAYRVPDRPGTDDDEAETRPAPPPEDEG